MEGRQNWRRPWFESFVFRGRNMVCSRLARSFLREEKSEGSFILQYRVDRDALFLAANTIANSAL